MTPFANWSPLTRRFVAVSLLVLSGFLLVDSVAAPVIGAFTEQTERMNELEAHYVGFAQAAARKPGLEQRSAALAADKGWRTRLIEAPSAEEAATVLQQRIRTSAATAGVELQSFEPINAPPANGFSRPGVKLELQAPGEALALFLETLRAAPALLSYENVSVRSQGGGGARDKLNVRMELIGYWYPPETAP